MPRGAQRGERRGGRQKRMPNKKTLLRLQREIEAKLVAGEVRINPSVIDAARRSAAAVRKRAKDELFDLIPIIIVASQLSQNRCHVHVAAAFISLDITNEAC